MSGEKYKVFVIYGCDWIVAYDEKSAIEAWESTTGETFDEHENDIKEETRNLSSLNFMEDIYNDETKKTPFDKKIRELLDSGSEKIPFFLATSEY